MSKLKQVADKKSYVISFEFYKKTGYFVQIKIDSILYNKAFLSAKDKDEEKLKKAKDWLALTKQTYEKYRNLNKLAIRSVSS